MSGNSKEKSYLDAGYKGLTATKSQRCIKSAFRGSNNIHNGSGLESSFLEGNSAKKPIRERSAFRSQMNLHSDGKSRPGETLSRRNHYEMAAAWKKNDD